MVVRDVPQQGVIEVKKMKKYYENNMKEASRDLERSVKLRKGERKTAA